MKYLLFAYKKFTTQTTVNEMDSGCQQCVIQVFAKAIYLKF